MSNVSVILIASILAFKAFDRMIVSVPGRFRPAFLKTVMAQKPCDA